ncbi:MAG TPA: acetate--CoA ligase family protein, partial [Aggregatilineales bacterium]|nr:acetate--CoA ligase family protein [Aggregatilineales bacterium]
ELAAAVEKFGEQPLAMKVVSKDILHKSDAGGVKLNLVGGTALRAAFDQIMSSCRAYDAKADIRGVLVTPMARRGTEVIVGVVRDPQFGPLVMAGLGGTHVELQRDVAFELAPLTREQANDLLDRTAAGRLLGGFRGAPPADREAVVDTILRLAQIALDWPLIAEIEINPLIVQAEGGGAVAVDARVRLAS